MIKPKLPGCAPHKTEDILMKAVVGIFNPSQAGVARDGLVSSGFRTEDIVEITTIDDMPSYLESEPEKTASWGWLFGIIVGGMLGALGGWLAAYLFNISSVIVSVLMGVAGGAVLGGYLSALYTLRADTQAEMDIHEALGQGKSLVLVQVNDEAVDTTTGIMEQYQSDAVEVYSMPVEKIEMA
jgi:hypothetical protein